MDRASGSGVFARDPDAMLDMIQLKVKDQDPDDIATAWRITGTLREFPSFPPVNVFFRYPVHVADDTDMLKDAMEEGSLADVYQKVGNSRTRRRRKKLPRMSTAWKSLLKRTRTRQGKQSCLTWQGIFLRQRRLQGNI